MVDWCIGVMATVIIVQRIVELYIANCNRIWMLGAGAQEFGAKHYPLFFLLHIGWLISWVGEAYLNGQSISEFWYLWLSLFMIAQGLRYWCITSLGRYWNTRILVIPNSQSIHKGPYRYLAHPNYLAVGIELVSVPLVFEAIITATLATLLNGILIVGIRIPGERHALQLLKSSMLKGNDHCCNKITKNITE